MRNESQRPQLWEMQIAEIMKANSLPDEHQPTTNLNRHKVFEWFLNHPAITTGLVGFIAFSVSHTALLNLHQEESAEFKKSLPIELGISEEELNQEQVTINNLSISYKERKAAEDGVTRANTLRQQIESRPEYKKRESLWSKINNYSIYGSLSILATLFGLDYLKQQNSLKKPNT